jgi:hypothetical protein
LVNKDLDNFRVLADMCRDGEKTLDGLFSELLNLSASGQMEAVLDLCMSRAPTVNLSHLDEKALPTLDFLNEL